MSTIKEKLKAVAAAVAAIEKQFGKGAIMPLGGGERRREIARHPHRLGRRSTSRSAWAACRAAASSRSSAPSRPARPR